MRAGANTGNTFSDKSFWRQDCNQPAWQLLQVHEQPRKPVRSMNVSRPGRERDWGFTAH